MKHFSTPKALLLTVAMLVCSLTIQAQNVTVTPKNGIALSSYTAGGSTDKAGLSAGLSAIWKHEQLHLTWTTSDEATLDKDGKIGHHNNSMAIKSDSTCFILVGKNGPNYSMVELPKGYKFTGYKFVLKNNVADGTIKKLSDNTSFSIQHGNYVFGECDGTSSWNYTNSVSCGSSLSETEYTLEKTFAADEGSNVLFFKFSSDTPGSGYLAALELTYVEFYFTADDFTLTVAPTETFSGVSYHEYAFDTDKQQYGEVTNRAVTNGSSIYKQTYIYANVTDIYANMIFYEEACVGVNLGTSSTTQTYSKEDSLWGKYAKVAVGNKSIDGVLNDGTYYYKIQSGQNYFLETPISATQSTSGYEAPLAYRITGATVNYCNPSTTAYTLRVWDYTGGVIGKGTDKENYDESKHYQDITVKAGDEGSVTVGVDEYGQLNNDAIRVQIISEDETVVSGYVNFNVQMQYLNPYLKGMSVVCKSADGLLKLSQNFEADDFSVSGGTFKFYVPKDYTGDKVQITFEDLNSQYATKDYELGTSGYARPLFAGSKFYNYFGDSHEKDVLNCYYKYRDTLACYNAHFEDDKVVVSNLATKMFTFNNLSTVYTSGGYIHEYAYSLSNYLRSQGGQFEEKWITVPASGSTTATTDTVFVFVSDVARYHIAPTTGTEHFFVAYYEMKVDVARENVDVTAEVTKIYDTTCYNKDGADADDAFYGVDFYTTDEDNNKVEGVAALTAVGTALQNALKAKATEEGVDSITVAQLLYVDLSSLGGIWLNDTSSLSKLYAAGNENAFIYLPLKMEESVKRNNLAAKEVNGSSTELTAISPVVITDRKPFYAKYNVAVPDTTTTTYARMKTWKGYKLQEYGTLIVPFDMEVDEEGKTKDGQFQLLTMNATQAVADSIKNASAGNKNYGTAYFSELKSVSKAAANTPYVIKYLKYDSTADTDTSFTIKLKGQDIVATPDAAKEDGNNYFFSAAEDPTATGILTNSSNEETTYTFTYLGTYAGNEFNKNCSYDGTEGGAFYFSNERFFNSAELKSYNTIPTYPFRSLYFYKASAGAKPAIKALNIVIGINEDTTTGIDNTTVQQIANVIGGYHTISISSSADQLYNVFTAAGQQVARVNVKAGQTETISVPAGVYVVKGKKVIVK